MNVVMASYAAVSILHGGPNTQLRNTAKFLSSHGVNVSLFDPWAPFKRENCDLFHVFGANIGTYHLVREIHALGIPIVTSPIIYSRHSHAFINTMLWFSRVAQSVGKGIWTDYALTADMCNWSARVLPNTKAEAELVVKGLDCPENKIKVIPNGVDERFANADPGLFTKTYGLRDFILCVGHTGHRRKNVLTLIKALGQINHPAVIIGRIIRGEYGDACVREAAKHKHIKLIDGLSNESEMLASAYAACDVFALPSLFETPGIAALEAGLAGAKIVITPYGGTKEYFADRAEYVEPDSVESIRKGIEISLAKPKTPELQTHIKNNFLWSHVGAQTAQIYREVLRRE